MLLGLLLGCSDKAVDTAAVEEACEQQYVLFVLKNGQPWENILFSVSYHA